MNTTQVYWTQLLTSIAILTSPPLVHARELLVDDDRRQCRSARYLDIGSAVQAAKTGDTISVCSGTYPGGITIFTDGIHLRTKASGSKVQIEPASDEQIGISILADDVTVSRLKVRKFRDAGIATGSFQGSLITATNNVLITGNEVSENGVGVRLSSNHRSRIENNFVRNNKENGIVVENSDHARLSGNQVLENGGRTNAGLGVFGEAGIRLTNSKMNNLIDNKLKGNTAGIFLSSSSENDIRSNSMETNKQDGITLCFGSYHNSIIANSMAGNTNCGLSVCDVGPANEFNSVVNNLLSGNHEYDIQEASETGASNNTFLGNSCKTSSPATYCAGPLP